MQTRLFYLAAIILTSCVFLTGLTMPDAPRPQRHDKAQPQAAIAEQGAAAKSRQKAESTARAKKAQSSLQEAKKNAIILDETAQPKHSPTDRTARTVLPAKKLR